eukprot:GHVQ01011909.1.p1 GENE.GHVQ01011909.1~~GHVQ01011909.1.p1  ORF type:complete len:364 (+),score=70.26 GHVQ01011909.1:257-1348(+)
MTVTVLSIISMRTIFPRLLYLSIGGFLLLPHLCCNTAPVEETSSWCNPESTDISLYNQCTVFSHHTHTTLPSHKGEEVGSFRGTSPVADTASSILADHSEHISTSSITLADDSTLNPDFMPTLSVPPLLHHKQQQQQQLQQHQQEEQQQQQQLQQHQQEEQQQQQQLQQHQQERRLANSRNQVAARQIVMVLKESLTREFLIQHGWYFLAQLLLTVVYLNLTERRNRKTLLALWWTFNIFALPAMFSVQRTVIRGNQEIKDLKRKIETLSEEKHNLTTELNMAGDQRNAEVTLDDVMGELALIRDKLEKRPEFARISHDDLSLSSDDDWTTPGPTPGMIGEIPDHWKTPEFLTLMGDQLPDDN